MLCSGLEEFEEKIDRIADGKDTSDDSWISRIYNQFVGEYGEVSLLQSFLQKSLPVSLFDCMSFLARELWFQ